MIHVDTAGAVYPLRIDPFIQVAKFSDPALLDQGQLGAFAVDVKGTTAVAALTTPTATTPPGAVDVFVANSGRWELGATRVAQLTGATDEAFGTSVALSADAKTIAVGAPSATVGMVSGEGKVYVFEQPAGGWTGTITTPTATLTGTPTGGFADSLGKSVSISSDASLIAAGAPGRASSAINPNVGAVLVFARPAMHWTNQTAPQATLTHGLGTTGDQLGFSVAMSGNGSTIVAGAPFGPNLHFLGEAWVFQQPPGGFVDNNNPNAVLLAPNAQDNDFFAQAVAISDDAKTIVAGATGVAAGRGAAFVFTAPTGTWTGAPAASATLTSSDGQQEGVGTSVATDGRVVVAGPFTAAVGGNMGQGVAYVFAEPAGGWSSETETQKLIAGDGQAGDGLGAKVGISNGTVIASASGTDFPGHQNVGSIYAFGSFPSTAISIAPATPSGSNGWYVHPVSLAVSASDLDQTVTAIRCVLDPAAAPIGFGALPAACAFLAPGARRRQRGARAVRVGRERSRLHGRSGQSVVQDRHRRSRREVRAHAQLHPEGQGWAGAGESHRRDLGAGRADRRQAGQCLACGEEERDADRPRQRRKRQEREVPLHGRRAENPDEDQLRILALPARNVHDLHPTDGDEGAAWSEGRRALQGRRLSVRPPYGQGADDPARVQARPQALQAEARTGAHHPQPRGITGRPSPRPQDGGVGGRHQAEHDRIDRDLHDPRDRRSEQHAEVPRARLEQAEALLIRESETATASAASRR